MELVENLHKFIRVSKEELILVVVIRHVNQAQLHQLFKSELPLRIRNSRVDRPPLLIVPPGDQLVGRALLSEEGELHLDVVMDIFIILKHDVVV